MRTDRNTAATVSPAAGFGMLALALLAMASMGVRLYQVRGELAAMQRRAALEQDLSTQSLLKGFSLPVNQSLRLCAQRNGVDELAVVASVYWDHDGALRAFDSAEHGWKTWPLSSAIGEVLPTDAESGWDGSAIFYAVEVQRKGSTTLIAGTSDELKHGRCVAVRGE